MKKIKLFAIFFGGVISLCRAQETKCVDNTSFTIPRGYKIAYREPINEVDSIIGGVEGKRVLIQSNDEKVIGLLYWCTNDLLRQALSYMSIDEGKFDIDNDIKTTILLSNIESIVSLPENLLLHLRSSTFGKNKAPSVWIDCISDGQKGVGECCFYNSYVVIFLTYGSSDYHPLWESVKKTFDISNL